MEYIKQNATAAGKCGEDMCWYYRDGMLLITGSGAVVLSEDMSDGRILSSKNLLG